MNTLKNKKNIDLDGFPVLRIDQIHLIDTNILEEAQTEVAELIKKMNLEGDKSQKSFIYYLNKQLDEMEKEIAKRVAEARVLALLEGNENMSNLEFRSKQPLFQPPLSPQSTSSKSSSIVPNPTTNDKPKFEPIPLPSEIRKSSAPPQTPQSSRSEQDIHSRSLKDEETPISEEIQQKRPKSGQPSRRSIAVVEENFGSSFVVGAIEKRKRFYPKKVPKETEADIRERNRESRRQIAMKRLLERKEKQIQRKEMEKKKKLLRKVEKAKSNKDLSQGQTADDNISLQPAYPTDSESEESLSGDDRDDNPEISETAIQNIIIEDDPKPSSDIFQVEEQVGKDSSEEATHSTNLAQENTESINSQEVINSVMGDTTGIDIPVRQEIDEDKSLAALSTLRKLKSKKMQSKNEPSLVPQMEAPLEVFEGQQSPLPQSPDSESLEIESHRELTACASRSLFDNYLVAASIISSITEDNHEVYTSSKGPDDLPGLKAWTLASSKLDSGDVKWIVNSHYYEELFLELHGQHTSSDKAMRMRLLNQRGKARRSITYGLVILSRMCESLMLGDIPCNSSTLLDSNFENDFRLRWGERLAKFDDVISEYHPQEKLFDQVIVCGNLYAICKKLENLLRTSGLSEIIKQIHENDLTAKVPSNLTDSVSQSNQSTLLCANNHQEKSDEQAVIQHTVLDDTQVAADTGSQGLNEETSAVVTETDDQPLVLDVDNQVEINNADDDDDDDALLPTSNDIFSIQKQLQSQQSISSKSTSLTMMPPPKPIPPKGTQMMKSKSNKRLVSSSSLSRTLSNNDKGVTTTPIFHNIAELFPAVHSLLRNIQKSGIKPGDHDVIARTLIECMTLQLKLYEEWIDIMDDYATVFCHDRERGVPTLMDEKDNNSLVYAGGSSALHYRVQSSRSEVSNIITDVLNNMIVPTNTSSNTRNWVELPQGLGLGPSWNLLWSWSKPKINLKCLNIFQRINHFIDSKQLTRKDLLKKNLSRLTDLNNSNNTNKYTQYYEIMPKTFLLPNEYTLFVREFTAIEALKQQQQQQQQSSTSSSSSSSSVTATATTATPPPPPLETNIWIMKPVGLSRGRGISLINDISSLTYSQNSVLQKYLSNPLCLNGYKFDLRLYVLVTSFHPLEAFIYKEGFARISTEKYSLQDNNLNNRFIHLTNSSIQKQNSHGPTSDNPLNHGDMNESNGSKIPLLGQYGLWKYLEEKGYNISILWSDISSLIIKSLLAVDDKISYQPCSFELFGYDILIDSNCRPWLIEVNSSPSLERGTQLDIRVKNQLISDIVQLVDPIPYNRSEFIGILKKRLKNIQSKTYSLSNTATATASSGSGGGAGSSTSVDHELNEEIKLLIGNNKRPRQYGEEPQYLGQFERLCPNTKLYSTALKIKNKLVKESPG